VMNLKEDDIVSAIALVVDAVEPPDELPDASLMDGPLAEVPGTDTDIADVTEDP